MLLALSMPPVLPSWDGLTDSMVRHALTPLVNALTHHAVPLMIVLDDYYIITNLVVHAALIFLVISLPPCVHIVLASRSYPSFSLAQFRAHHLCEHRDSMCIVMNCTPKGSGD